MKVKHILHSKCKLELLQEVMIHTIFVSSLFTGKEENINGPNENSLVAYLICYPMSDRS